ncbi:TRAP transporter substrate-binding protein [Mesorhizobium sp. M7D.F.Ca.US.004.01.2.1]|uniref:TRAP transporter substrate-binding protein n=1 Tax=Mesorhizobium sp. M7D.F.Ca.US.004.01.2.1 TaxID=2496738 RepID=UPI000FC9F730|nr:TRAP transporter substrate-binding protein [Mesorhizobium sp. M7D.F.Ca.US.004.01.2.1]RUX91996.1 TRAP transporter substrate-binding protein [Mesorhizobium sp. M7D.F.Ca.US.004.01.2.1]
MVQFGNELTKRSDGRIQVTFFPDAQLGGNEIMINSVKVGALDGVMSNLGVLSAAVPQIEVLELPFLFDDTPHAVRALNGALGDSLKPDIEKGFNCRVVGWGTDGTRLMWNKVRPIRKPEDLAGLKMRVQASRTHQDTYAALGALPTVVPFSELYAALQTGVVDGADVGVVDLLSLKFYQVTKYVSFTKHVSILDAMLISNSFLEKLSPDDLKIVIESGQAASKIQVEHTLEVQAGAVEPLKKHGLEFFDVDDLTAFKSKMAPVYDAMKERVPGGAELIALARTIK